MSYLEPCWATSIALRGDLRLSEPFLEPSLAKQESPDRSRLAPSRSRRGGGGRDKPFPEEEERGLEHMTFLPPLRSSRVAEERRGGRKGGGPRARGA